MEESSVSTSDLAPYSRSETVSKAAIEDTSAENAASRTLETEECLSNETEECLSKGTLLRNKGRP